MRKGIEYSLWFGIALAIGLNLARVEPAHAASSEPYNVLFLFADDQRPDTLRALGNSHIQTPNIDRLVEGGTTFLNAYCMGSWSGAVCLPSRAMLNTGRTLWHVNGNLEGYTTWGEMMQRAGYNTFGTGKWHNGVQSFIRSFQYGDADFLGGMSDHYNVPVNHLTPQGELERYDARGIHSSVLFADAAIDFLNQQVGFNGSDDPFFMYVAFTSAHDPRDPPVSFRKAYYREPPPAPENFMPQHPFDNGHMVLRDEVLAPWPRSKHVVREQLCEYYGLITHMDEQIGRIFDALKRTGEWDETIIVYTADHGLAMGSHGLLGKQNLYEHSMGTPLVFYGPGIPQGEKRDALVYLLDILPTVCELNQVQVPDQVEGRSLVPVLRGNENRVRDSLYTAYRDVQRAVRDERWKLIRYPRINHTQLFDLESDPLELNNLADESKHAKRVDAMMNRLKDWQQRLGDDLPLRVEDPKPKEIDLTGHKRSPDRHQPDWIREKYFDLEEENENDDSSNAP